MAVVEVCVVAWLAWGVVVSLFGMVLGGSGAVLGRLETMDTPLPKNWGDRSRPGTTLNVILVHPESIGH